MTWYFLRYSNRISFYADDIRDSWFNNVNIYYTNIFKYDISNVEMQCLLSAESPCVWELVLLVNLFFFYLNLKKWGAAFLFKSNEFAWSTSIASMLYMQGFMLFEIDELYINVYFQFDYPLSESHDHDMLPQRQKKGGETYYLNA